MILGRLRFGASVLLIVTIVTIIGVTKTDQGQEFLGQLPSAERFYTRWIPPEPPVVDDQINPREVESLEQLGREVTGRLVWSSNRGGNHDLYLADLSTGSVRQLTDHPHVDYLSRFSPDGVQISFLRSRRPWVSFREENAWDLFIMDADGSDVRRLVEHAYHPTWDPDGSGLVFLRKNRILRVDLLTGDERVLHDGRLAPLEGRIGDPELAPDGRLAVTVRRRNQRVGVLGADRGTWTAVSGIQACHITWVPGEDRVVWVRGKQGRGGNRIMHGRPGAGDAEVLIDLPGSHSHEYFPRVTNDSQWLVWGATAHGHEHDRADYEIFVWRIRTPWASALRVTHSTANDQWPDLYVDGNQ